MKKHKPDHFEEQLQNWLSRRKGQTITDEMVDDFAVFVWRRKMVHDLALMKEMINRKVHIHH